MLLNQFKLDLDKSVLMNVRFTYAFSLYVRANSDTQTYIHTHTPPPPHTHTIYCVTTSSIDLLEKFDQFTDCTINL